MTEIPPVEEIKEEAARGGMVVKNRKNRKLGVWAIVGIIAAALAVVGGAGGGYLIHLSNTNPEFCATRHIMDKNVSSYLVSNDLDNIHYQANIACKDCHDYPIPAEIRSGVKFVLGDLHCRRERRSAQSDLSQCHNNGAQRLIGEPYEPRDDTID